MNDMSARPVSPPEMSSAEALQPKERRSRLLAKIGMAASVILFCASLVILWLLVSEIDVNELKSAFTAASLRQVGLAVLFTAVSYGLLTCYDAIALRQLKLQIPYRTTALASFTSYAVSFTLGFPLLTAGTVRYWIYSSKGVKPGRVANLTVITGITFWLGMVLVLAWSLIRQADELANLIYYTHVWLNQLVGLSAATFVLVYMLMASFMRRSVRILGWKLELPGFRLSLAQTLIGAADVCAGAAVLFILLPGGHDLSFETFLAVYILAVMIGMVSQAPGGLGVFEATILLALSSYPREPVLGALLLYRLCYYLVPFVIALALLGGYEIRNRIRAARLAFKPDEDEVVAEAELGGR